VHVQFTCVLQIVYIVYTIFLGSILCCCVFTERLVATVGIEPRKFIYKSLDNQYDLYVPRIVTFLSTTYCGCLSDIRPIFMLPAQEQNSFPVHILEDPQHQILPKIVMYIEEVNNEVCRSTITLEK